MVRVEPQRPGEEMVQRTVSELIEQRLLTVRQELLARPVLQKAIEEINLYPEIVSEKGMEAAVEQMRKDLEVKVEGENAFELTYSARDPEVAAKVANRLPPGLRRGDAQAAPGPGRARHRSCSADEMEELKKSVTDWEKRIAQFKVDHMGELPEQLEMNMRGLERVGDAAADQDRGAARRRGPPLRPGPGSQRRRTPRPAACRPPENGLDPPAGRRADHLDRGSPRGEAAARASCGTMAAQRKDAEGRMVAERQERARAAGLVAQPSRRTSSELQKQAETYQERLDSTPHWAHELGVMNRDYEIARTKYQSVVSRKVEAEIAQELEAKSAKSLFNVISPAGVPVVTGQAGPRRAACSSRCSWRWALGVLTGRGPRDARRQHPRRRTR